MQTSEQRSRIVQYFKDEYAANSKVPSVRSVCEKFRLDTKSFYKIFGKGKGEICDLASIPVDRQSFERIEKAATAMRNKREKEPFENEELRVLREKEVEISKELKKAQAFEEMRERVRRMETTLASTRKGRVQVFSSPRRLLDFAIHTVDYEALELKNPTVLDYFLSCCEEQKLEPASTLLQVVGPLEGFEAEDETEIDLAGYIGFQLETFLIDREREQRQKAMQAKFEGILRDFRCSECGRDATALYLVDSRLYCPCGSKWDLFCVNCKKELRFDPKIEALHCRACGMSFRFVVGQTLFAHNSLSNP